MGTGTLIDGNTHQQPIGAEPGGATWHKTEDPGTGWLASKAAAWTADRFSTATGGMAVDFSSVVPTGTRAALVGVYQTTTPGAVYSRAAGDTKISNTPQASSELSVVLMDASQAWSISELYLSSDYRAEIAVNNTAQDIYVAYPKWYLL